MFPPRRAGWRAAGGVALLLDQHGSSAAPLLICIRRSAGILLPQPLTVMTTNQTNFIGVSGLSGLSSAGAVPLRIVGYVLINSQTGSAVLVATAVEELTASS